MRRNVPIRRERNIRAHLNSLMSAGRLQGEAIEQANDDYLDLYPVQLVDAGRGQKLPREGLSPKEKRHVKRREKKRRLMSRQGMEGGSNA